MSSSRIGSKRERDTQMDPRSLWLHSILIDALTRRDQTHRGLNALTRLRTTDGSHIALDTKAPAAISTPLMDAIANGRHTSIPECWKAKCRHLQALIDEADAAPPVDEFQQLPTLEDQEELEALRQVVLQGIDTGVVVKQEKQDIKHSPVDYSEGIKVEVDTHLHSNDAITVKQEEMDDDEEENNTNSSSSRVVCGPHKPHQSETDTNQAVEEPQAPAAPRNPKSKLGKLIFQAKKKLGATEETTMQQPLQHQPLAAVTRRAPLSAAKSSELLSSSTNGIRRGITMDNDDGSDDDGYESSTNNNNTTTSTTQPQQQNKQLSYEEFLQTTHKRAPRQGEIGITVDEIESAEALGYVMSGSRNRNVQKSLDSKQRELHEKQADKDRLRFLAEDDRRKDEEAVEGLLDLF